MNQIMQILRTALEALANHNVNEPSEVEMFQGMRPSEWWVHTNVGYYVCVQPLRALPGLWASVHEYIV
jgi:hypothetical protein